MAEIRYAIGSKIENKNSIGYEYGMHHGPHPSEAEMLKISGNSDEDYIIRLITDADRILDHDLIWKWDVQKEKWTRWNPRVLNKGKDTYVIQGLSNNQCVYIGRGSKWGNPFKITESAEREEVILKYAEYIVDKPDLLASLHELKNKFLICHCAPLPCHGDILIELANEIDTGEDKPWEFGKHLPDDEDIDIKTREAERYLKHTQKHEFTAVDIFNAGFIRGLAWGLAKAYRSNDFMARVQMEEYRKTMHQNDYEYHDDIPF